VKARLAMMAHMKTAGRHLRIAMAQSLSKESQRPQEALGEVKAPLAANAADALVSRPAGPGVK
jgi:hypothetical protein